MALPKQGEFTFKHSTQPDKPSMTAAQLKASFDAQGNELKTTINAVVDALEKITSTSGAENIGSAPIAGVTGGTVYAQMADIKSQLTGLVLDQIPDATITLPKMAPDVQGKLNQIYTTERAVANLMARSSITNRTDGASGFIYDLNDGLNGGSTGKIDFTTTNIVGATSVGTSTVTVKSVTGIVAGQELTIFDDVNLERPIVQAVDGTAKMVTFSVALTKAYKDQAQLCRSSVVQDTTNKLLSFGGWSKIGTVTVTSPETVVASAYDTSGNGGRRLVRLDNGWIVALTGSPNGSTYNPYWYISKDNGVTWSQLCFSSLSAQGFSMVSKGTMIYTIHSASSAATQMGYWKFDAANVTNVSQAQTGNVDTGQTAFSAGVSLAIDDAGTELHAAWSSKNATYPNSFNIRYAKGTIAGDGAVTWGAVVQVTVTNVTTVNFVNPTITEKNGFPHIIASFSNTTAPALYHIYDFTTAFTTKTYLNDQYVTSSWGCSQVVTGGNNQPNQTVVKSPDGTFHVAYSWIDTVDTTKTNINYMKSTNGGVTWTGYTKLTSGNVYAQTYPSITSDKNNNVYIVWFGTSVSSTVNTQIRKITWNGTAWSSVIDLTTNTTADARYPTVLQDNTLDFSDPLVIYWDLQTSSIKFRGTWITGTTTPVLVEDVRYNIVPPSNVSSAVAWVDRQTDAGLSLAAALSIHSATENFTAMTKTTSTVDGTTSEDQFTGSGASNSKATLRVTMTRTNTSINKSITQILGAVGS